MWNGFARRDDWFPPGPPCPHVKLEIDRTLCPCGFRHVYCVLCETRIDQDVCPWIPADGAFVAMMTALWNGTQEVGLD